VITRFGPPQVLTLESVPDPSAGPGQVVIDVEYAGVTFVETQVRAGRPPNPAMAPRLPLTPGNGVGGRIAEVGDGVDDALIEAAVVSTTGGSGGYAERVAVPAELPIAIPDGVSVRAAVALLADGRTALALVRAAELSEGDTVLVEAAAGGVGTCLVQLARAAGATVVGGVGSAGKRSLVEGLGAAMVVDYSRPGWERRIRAEVGAVDVVFDGVGGDIGSAALNLVRAGGRFCRYGMASGSFTDRPASERRVEIVEGTALTPSESRLLSIEALDRAAAGDLVATIGQEFDLEHAADAHAAIEARVTVGKTLLRAAR
jgi:NADPH:quinone reductase